MTYSDLIIHYERLRDVRAEILENGDVPPNELEERLRQVKTVLVRIKRRQEQLASAKAEAARGGELELELADVQAA